MSQIDSLSLSPVWFEVGRIQGLISGLRFRKEIIKEDLDILEESINRLAEILSKSCGFEKEKEKK
mgnify:CR=1 FL=1